MLLKYVCPNPTTGRVLPFLRFLRKEFGDVRRKSHFSRFQEIAIESQTTA
jgi:hypothetical protein